MKVLPRVQKVVSSCWRQDSAVRAAPSPQSARIKCSRVVCCLVFLIPWLEINRTALKSKQIWHSLQRCLGLLRDNKAEGEEPEEKEVFLQNLRMTSFESLGGLGIAFSLLTTVVANWWCKPGVISKFLLLLRWGGHCKMNRPRKLHFLLLLHHCNVLGASVIFFFFLNWLLVNTGHAQECAHP